MDIASAFSVERCEQSLRLCIAERGDGTWTVKALERNAAEGDAPQRRDDVTEAANHLAKLTIASLPQRHEEHLAAGSALVALNVAR